MFHKTTPELQDTDQDQDHSLQDQDEDRFFGPRSVLSPNMVPFRMLGMLSYLAYNSNFVPKKGGF